MFARDCTRDRASGPTVSLVSSPRPLQAKIVLLQEMPYLDMWTGDHFRPDYASSRWRSSATHAAFSQCLKAHRNVQKRIEDARYCHLPVGMSITGLDWLQSAADILFARSLRAADHVLWAADTSIPETAGEIVLLCTSKPPFNNKVNCFLIAHFICLRDFLSSSWVSRSPKEIDAQDYCV